MYAILTFHSIDDQGSVISYRPRHFALLLEMLARRKIPVLDLDTLLAPETRRGVALTFDDGMRSVYRAALPVLRDHAVPAHLFLATGAVDSATPWPPEAVDGHTFDMLNWDEIGALHGAGVAIECHTRTHPDMRTLTGMQMQDECEQADALIGERLGRRPQYFAYPYGYHNRQVRDFARPRYRGCVTTELRPLGTTPDSAALPRLDTFYLQSERLIRAIGSLRLKGYLATRNILRNVKGSQCRAGCA
ncbi:MAG: polysaccharide deacetylase family protein [Gammaproteobacteria bacterium]|jgi:peptidoglycan/xylan/chitin deacetylase (PgdA/CDA1 family)